jgi:hypothetical protein
MPSSYRIRYLVSAPLILIAGLTVFFWGRRAAALGGRVHAWADSLNKGSGPVRIDLGYIPVYIGGKKIGMLDTVVVQRHVHGSVDSLRLVVRKGTSAASASFESCAVRLISPDRFDPGAYKQALQCAADTTGLARFGQIVFAKGVEAPLYMNADDVTCSRNSTDVRVAAAAGDVDVLRSCGHGGKVRVGVSRAEIQRIVREATVDARQAQVEARQARQAAEAVKRQPLPRP